ncbi:MAG: MarR family winged helix-turn-helix transcriptional regulator [Paracoccaceae bacterium]
MKDTVDPFEARFGPLARHLFEEAPLAAIWRLSFLANFFTGPAYVRLQAEHGLGRPAFVVLYCLHERDGLMARDVVRVSGLPKNSVSRAVADLVERGLVAAGAGRQDRRAKPLHLTPASRALLRQTLPDFAARQEALLAPLDEAERTTLRNLLGRLADGLPDWVDGEDEGAATKIG